MREIVAPPAESIQTDSPASRQKTAFFKNDPSISPDGHWLAYESVEGLSQEVYVRPFPNVNDGQWQVSTAGGKQPPWGRDGRELFYLDRSGLLTVVPVKTKPTFTYSKPNKLLDTRYYTSNGPWTYDISPDVQRFLMLKDSTTGNSASPVSMVVVLNWMELNAKCRRKDDGALLTIVTAALVRITTAALVSSDFGIFLAPLATLPPLRGVATTARKGQLPKAIGWHLQRTDRTTRPYLRSTSPVRSATSCPVA